MTEVIMTKMGDAMEEGLLTRWVKNEGEAVSEGESIAEVQTDKAIVDLVAPASGTLKVQAKEGDSIPIGAVIAYVLAEGENAPENGAAPAAAGSSNGAGKPDLPKATGADAPKEGQNVAPSAVAAQEPVATSLEASAVSASGGRVKASPLAKKMASQAGIDLGQVRGTGPQGRIVERDLKPLIANKPAQAPVTAPSVPQPAIAASAPIQGGQAIELSRMRKAIAQRTVQSKQTVPHFYVTSEVDMEAVLALRAQFNADLEGDKLSINDFILKACAVALVKHPNVNTMYQDDKLIPLPNVNIGVAVAIEEGLVIPVVRECENKSMKRIAAEVRRLAEKGRSGQLTPDEMSGSSFAVSNLGMYDVENFIAIINPPNSAILAVGSAAKVPVVMPDDTIVPRTRMKMTLSADHRVLDGATAALFVKDVKTLLENPFRLVE